MPTSEFLVKTAETYRDLVKLIPRKNKHMSIVLRRNRVIAVGVNACKTHPMAREHGYRYCDMHSELAAYLKIPRPYLSKRKLVLLNISFNRFGAMRMAKPCPLCAKWCTDRFDEIYFTHPDQFIERFNP